MMRAKPGKVRIDVALNFHALFYKVLGWTVADRATLPRTYLDAAPHIALERADVGKDK